MFTITGLLWINRIRIIVWLHTLHWPELHNNKSLLWLYSPLPLNGFSPLTFRRSSGSRLPASPGRSPLRHGGEVDAKRTQGTQPVHGDCPRDRTHSGTGTLPSPSCLNVAILQETGPQPGAELGRHHCSAAAVRWDDGAFYGDLFQPTNFICGFILTVWTSICLKFSSRFKHCPRCQISKMPNLPSRETFFLWNG